jgi:uncharacterized protein YkwD
MNRMTPLVLLTTLVACGPQPSGPSLQTSPHSVATASPSSSAPSPTPSAIGLNTSADIRIDPDLQQALATQIQAQTKLQNHPALSTLAQEHAQQLANNPKDLEFKAQSYNPLPPTPLVTRILNSNFFPSDNLASAYLSDNRQEQIFTRFEQQLRASLGVTPFTHYGLGVVQRGGTWFVSTILATEIVQLEGIDLRNTQPGARTIKGKIVAAGYQQPSALITQPDGNVVTAPIRINGQNFELDANFSQTGYYSFEINVESAFGPQPATNFVIPVGVAPLASEPTPNTSAPPVSNVATAQQELLTLVNRDRAEQGLSQLQLDPKLNQAAQNHSQDMVSNGFIGHNSPTRGTPQQQAAATGVTELVGQNIAISRSLANSQRELMSSPGHRRIIIDPKHTHVGFGVVNGSDGFLYITQFFAGRRVELDPLPTKIKAGDTVVIAGKALSNQGFIGIFQDRTLLMEPQNLSQNPNFRLELRLSGKGTTQLRIGFSEAPTNGSFTFNFSNIWTLNIE